MTGIAFTAALNGFGETDVSTKFLIQEQSFFHVSGGQSMHLIIKSEAF